MPVDHQLQQQFLADQGGVLSVAQADQCGISPTMARRRVATGQWWRILPGVISPTGPPGHEGMVRAAMLWAGPGSVLCGEAALWWWGLIDRPPDTVSVVVPNHRRRRSYDFVSVHRQHVPDADRTTERRIRTVSKAYAVLFAGRHLGAAAQKLLDRALLREFTLEEFDPILERNKNVEGVVDARRLLRSASDGTAAESERLLARLLREAGVTGWTVNRRRRVAGRSFLPDFTFEQARVIVELDGWAFHSDPERFQRDRVRQNLLVTDGWTVLRFTWAQLTEQPDEVIRTILRALARSGHQNER